MKKELIGAIVALLALSAYSPLALAEDDCISTLAVAAAQSITLSGSYTSGAIPLHCDEGLYSLQLAITGDGTLKVETLLSNDGVTYREAEGASDVIAAATKTSGPSADGKLIKQFFPQMGKYMKLKFSETGGVNSVTVTAVMARR